VPTSRPEAQGTDAWGAESHARADTERRQRLFDWTDALLKRLGLTKAVTSAKSAEALRTITLDVDDAEVILAINDALHPASGKRAEHCRGLKEGGLKRILASRFAELKKSREAELGKKPPDWTDDLLRDKHDRIRPVLANLTLMFQRAPAWQGTLAYNEFSAQVIIKRTKASSPLGKVAPGTAWVDHHEALARIWFQRKQIYPAMGDVGRAAAAAAKDSPFHPLRSLFETDTWDGKPRLQTWPQDYLGAEDTPYIRAIAPRYLISGVARIYEPGCQVDHVLVLE